MYISDLTKLLLYSFNPITFEGCSLWLQPCLLACCTNQSSVSRRPHSCNDGVPVSSSPI